MRNAKNILDKTQIESYYIENLAICKVISGGEAILRHYLKKMRNNRKLTQRQCADRLCISESYYSLIENGERQGELRANMLVKLAQLFGCTVDELLQMEAKGNEPDDVA